MDTDEKKYGKLLYEESDKYFNDYVKKGISASGLTIFAGFCGLIVGIYVMFSFSNFKQGLIISILSILGLCFCFIMYYGMKNFTKFQIYDHGIIFRGVRSKLLRFSDIDYIIVSNHNRRGNRSFSIRKKGAKYIHHTISELNNQYREDYELIYKLIVKRLKMANKRIPNNKLIIQKEDK